MKYLIVIAGIIPLAVSLYLLARHSTDVSEQAIPLVAFPAQSDAAKMETNTTVNTPMSEAIPPLIRSHPDPSVAQPISAVVAQTPDAQPADPDKISGRSACPVGGKPTAPLDIEWDLQRKGNSATGTITLKNLSSSTMVELTIASLGSAAFETPYSESVIIEHGQAHAYPISVNVGEGKCAIVVTAICISTDRRGRTIAIDLSKNKESKTEKPTPQPSVAGVPLSGIKTLIDAQGTVIEFHPATDQK